MRKRKGIIAAALAMMMTVSLSFGMVSTVKADTCGGLEPEDVYEPSDEEVIKDPLLHWAIRSAMNAIKGNVTLTAEMVGDKSVKHITYEMCAHPEDFETDEWKGKQFWIENLEGLQYAKSATQIDIAYTSAVEGKRLADLSPLSDLTQLQELILKQNGIDDISALKKLVNLTWLDISGNKEITDISSVQDMAALKRFIASHNSIDNADAIAGLENLEYLDLSYNQITSLPDMSKLKKVYFFDASHNQITDVSVLSGMQELRVLNLSGNTGITDIRPLANLLKLEKENTVLPDESKKDDLFAAIEVNKLFSLFNISKMQESDLPNVERALEAYNALTDEQKTYMDTNRVEAAKSNKTKVENGGEPDYYPEYDIDGEKQPIWDRLEIKVVDKKGVPMSDVEFTKISATAYAQNTATVKTDSIGRLILRHSAADALYDLITITPAGDLYVANPESITYTVNWGNTTATINGIVATGLEELQFTLIPKEEYVDKSSLEAALAEAKNVGEAYKYTESSYSSFENAMEKAQNILADVEATKDDVESAITELKTAIANLAKTDILTELKLIVKDENGNTFTRPFKFQIRVPGTGAEAWNQLSDAETSIAYLPASPAWEDGKTWEIVACYQEPYDIEPITVTVGVKDGKRYYKTVNGKNVDVDFAKEVLVTSRKDGAPDKENERKPDSTVLEKSIAEAKEYSLDNYTTASADTLKKVIEDAENLIAGGNATQNDYNAAVAAIKQAEAGLTELANKAELQKLLNMNDAYSEEYYTAESWAAYKEKLDAAEAVYKDNNATQVQVDEACAILTQARAKLVAKADKTKLKEALENAKALNADDYQSGFEALQTAIGAAQNVYDDEKATQTQVNAQITALEEAMKNLVGKTVEVDYGCQSGRFRARVVGTDGKPIAGVSFQAWIGDKEDTDVQIISDANGVIAYYTYGPAQYGKTVYVKLADSNYTTSDEHYFTVTNSSFTASIATLDGQSFAEGTQLTYVLRKDGEDMPNPPAPSKVLSDEQTFRAKVVDEDGNPVNGVKFAVEDTDSSSYEVTSKDGVIERTIGRYEVNRTFTVKLKANQDAGDGKSWACSTVHTYKNGGDYINGAKITEIDGTALAEVDEIQFVLKKSSDSTPTEVNKKELDDQIFFAQSYINKADDYTAESFRLFREALETAKIVYNDAEATQEQVDEATANLKTARENLVKADKPAVCNKYNIRIQVVDEAGNKVTERIPFTALIDGYKATWYSNSGVVEYAISTADYGTQKIIVSLQGDSIVLDGKEYVVIPEQHEFTIQSSSADVLITEIDREALSGNKEVKFVLKEVQSEADKSALEAKLAEVKAIVRGNYTINSYNALQSVIANAEKLVEDSGATQAEVDEKVQALSDAQAALREVTGMRTLTIPVQFQNGVSAPANTKFIRYDCKYYVENNMFTKNGVLEWKLGSYEGGDYEFYLPEGSVYIGTPERIKVHVGTEDGTPVIETINGVPAAEASAKFTITQRGIDTCDILTFRALIKDSEGNALSNVRFKVANGDPSELVSDENGMIEYEVTAWDTDTTMTVSLVDGQGWYTDESVVFSVIQDPEVPDRGIIDTINGQPLDSNQAIVFTLNKKETVKADKTALQELMDKVGLLDKEKYTAESYTKVEEELAKAVQVIADESASQEEVDAQAEKLQAAINALVFKDPGNEPTPGKTGWQKDATGWWYKNADGSYPYSTWKAIDGAWYYFNASGYRVTGWQIIGGSWYYLDENTGVMAHDEWIDGFYVTGSGAMANGWAKLEDGWYYFGTNGIAKTGWIQVGNNWYYGQPDSEIPGLLVENAFRDINGATYYFKAGGYMAISWQVIGGVDYFFTGSGAMAKNQWSGSYYLGKDGKMVSNAWVGVYHVGADGAYQIGWLKLEEGWYYLGTGGAVQTGWIQVGNNWYYGQPGSEKPGLLLEEKWLNLGNATYYFKAGGCMAISWQVIDGEDYFFTGSGAMAKSQWSGHYYLKADGKMARNEWVDGGKYFVDENGVWVPNAKK